MEINELVKNKHNFNLAGIIPVAGQPLDFNFPWHDALAPIGHNYLAVEKAVFNCAIAGCDTIWLVCPKDMQPLIRYRLGDYIVDPIKYYESVKFAKIPKTREIPIYYCAMEPKNVDRRDCLAWSIITGAQYSYQVGKQISRWTTPDRYFVSFPYGMFTPYYMSDARAKISSNDPFYVSYEGKSFKDGLYLPFTFTPEDFLQCRRTFRKNEARGYDSNVERLPLEERYTGRYFTHDFVFNEVITDDAAVVELPWYYDISSWDKLKLWLGSEHKLKKPPKFISSYNEWNPLGRDVEK
tara:strand:+ start:715 stop:1599 length:885 start_codon:yes stop_codon:yes gene_type:complete